ncbi:hypothetical protein [Geothrix sp. 21YS21S-2]|uniref:hypothetical protein n=1 Tax=Geothrix sp. 21YS21S-2 TaxID=3068893 RepID=UPI0027B9F79B|nr:hypothetical protein [Geothrix sp. 21YS21S-2]
MMINPSPSPRRTSAYRTVRRFGCTLLTSVLILGCCQEALGAEVTGPVPIPGQDLPHLAFKDFFEVDASAIKPSGRLLALSGKRVRLVGFMAKMEVAPKGAFYLTPRPVSCDEEGGGTADLPPEAVYVVVRSSPGQEVPYTPSALEVTGRLQVGYRVEEDERVTHIRLLLDRPEDLLGMSPKHARPPHPTEAHP